LRRAAGRGAAIAAWDPTWPGWNCGSLCRSGWRYPDFELSDPAAVTWSAGQVCGPRALPVTIRQNGR